jgi:hypothetical protein
MKQKGKTICSNEEKTIDLLVKPIEEDTKPPPIQ